MVGDFFGNFFENLGKAFLSIIKGITDFFVGTIENIANIFSWLGNFFTELFDFFLHIFVPTDEQWQEIQGNFTELGDTVKGKIPFVQMFSEELKTAQEVVEQTDFLIIKIPSFSFNTGTGISQTGEQVINFSARYEPYRMTIRTGLLYIAYGSVFVFLIKHILNYTQVNFGDGVNTKGGDQE